MRELKNNEIEAISGGFFGPVMHGRPLKPMGGVWGRPLKPMGGAWGRPLE
jgi:hypothetical protein